MSAGPARLVRVVALAAGCCPGRRTPRRGAALNAFNQAGSEPSADPQQDAIRLGWD